MPNPKYQLAATESYCPMRAMSPHDRIAGALLGAVVGDALGVPVEFSSREECLSDPVTGMRGYGTWDQDPGTWSDDSSLLLATAGSLLEGFDLERMGKEYVAWLHEGEWRPYDRVFDVGETTLKAIDVIFFGAPAGEAGSDKESANGNGSLMHILPVGLAFANAPLKELCETAESASAITHSHIWPRMACSYYCLAARRLLRGEDKFSAVRAATDEFVQHYEAMGFGMHLGKFGFLINEPIATLTAASIESSGFVIDTLNASIWCLLRETSYAASVLTAVNLGGDTDTIACVAGGLAGLLYGRQSIPAEWLAALARQDEVVEFTDTFAHSLLGTEP